MDIIRPISKHIIFPLYELKEGRHSLKKLKELMEYQYMPRELAGDLQLKRLKDLLHYAAVNCDYYKSLFKTIKFDPSSVKSIEDIKLLPVLSKGNIKDNLDKLIADEYRHKKKWPIRTGGSTSVPLRLFINDEGIEHRKAVTLRHNSWAGYEPGDLLGAIWGNTDKEYSFKERLYNILVNRSLYLDTLKMDDKYILSFVNLIKKKKVRILMGHSHSVFKFAEFIKRKGINGIQLRGIITTAEMLYDHERKVIEEVFGNIVFNRYGCEEVGLIASECEEHDGLHINSDGLIAEVLNSDEKKPGRIIITDLYNRAVPLIRYDIMDMATIKTGPCRCGRTLPRLGKIMGRTTNFLYTPEGKMVSGVSILDTFTIHIPGIKQVQIIQDKIDELKFKIVKDDGFNEKSLSLFTEKIPGYFGKKMKYHIEYVHKIPQTERGKYNFSICNIPKEKINKIQINSDL